MQKIIECDIEASRPIIMAPQVSTAIPFIRRVLPSRFAGNGGTGFSWTQLFVLTAMLLVAKGVVAEEPKKVNARDPLPIQQKPIDYFSGESKDPIKITPEFLSRPCR